MSRNEFMLPNDQGKHETMDCFQGWAAEYGGEMKMKPSFKDYWTLVVKGAGGERVFDKESIEWMGSQWEFTRLGKSEWDKIWNDNDDSSDKPTHKYLQKTSDKTKTEPNSSNASRIKLNLIKRKIMTKTTLKWVLIIAYIIALFFVPKLVVLVMIIAPLAILIIRSVFGTNNHVQKLEELESRVSIANNVK